jgi:hypothetical protein
MKHHIKDGDRLIATIETHGQAIVVVHEPQKEIKPVQFSTDRDTYVECTPEQRAEIIRVADEYGRELYDVSKDVEFYRQTYKNLAWNMDDDGPYLYETNRTKLEDAGCLWLPFDEFVARLKGEWVEPTEEPKTNLLYPEGLEAVVKDGEIPKSIWCNYNGTKYEYRLVEPDAQPTKEPAQPDYLGKWVKCLWPLHKGEWAKIVVNDIVQVEFSDFKTGHFQIKWFDLTDIRDTNPDEVERIIPFDIERWRSGEFVRVQTRDGREVKQLTEFESVKFGERFSGVFNLSLKQWYEHGAFLDARIDDRDLMLVVKGEGGKP